jgi:hypothetical protein
VFGVSKRDRRSYKVWQEGGKLPSFVLEITSQTTRRQDEDTKARLYESLGVLEYFQYDPTGDYLNPQLKGQRLVQGTYGLIPMETRSDGATIIHSQTLGLDLGLMPLNYTSTRESLAYLVPVTRKLRFIDPQSGAALLDYDETEQARLEAERIAEEERQRAEEERQRADRAEQQLAELLARLTDQGIDSNL